MIILVILICALTFFPVGFMLSIYGMYNQIDKAARTKPHTWTCCGKLYEIHEVKK